MSERASYSTADDNVRSPEWDKSPSGLDLNPRPPRPVRISKRAAGLLMALAAVVLGLFAYGGYKRQQRQVAALAEGDTRKNVVPALSAGADIAKDIPTGNLPNSPAAQSTTQPGVLQPPGGAQASRLATAAPTDRVIVRQPPVAPAPIQTVREPTPEERRLIAAYEREQQAIHAPTTVRESFGLNYGGNAPRDRSGASDSSQLASMLGALAKANSGSGQITPETIRAFLGGRRERADTPDYDEQNLQARKEEFLAKARANQTGDYLKSTRNPPLSPYEIKAGWEIPAVMEQALNSDLPGEVKALVTSNVYDSATGQHLLIPQGSRLVGVYSSQIGYGQDGVQVVWHRVIYPDASSLNLGGMVAQDAQGSSAFRHKVDRHYKRLIGFAVLTSLFAAASDLAQSRNRSLLTYPTRGEVLGSTVGREASELGAQITRRNLNIQPTIKIPVGYKFNVRVNRDILFDAPYTTAG